MLEEFMMRASFGLVSQHPPSKCFLFFLEKIKLLIFPPLGIYDEWLREFSFSSRVSYLWRYLRCVEIEMIEYCVDRLFAGILWWILRFIQTAFPELVHMAFVSVFWSLDNKDMFANPLFDGAYFPECHVIFVGH